MAELHDFAVGHSNSQVMLVKRMEDFECRTDDEFDEYFDELHQVEAFEEELKGEKENYKL